MSSVLRPWVEAAPWKMQSILLSGLRAPDFPTVATKKICRWMRALAQNNADPSKGYMEPQVMDQELVGLCLDELEYLPCHYVHHFADALRVVAIYYHPFTESYIPSRNEVEQFAEIRHWAEFLHGEIAQEIFHFKAETMQEFMERHKDKVDHS